MAFATQSQALNGPEIGEMTTDKLGFTALNGDIKLRILSSPWPASEKIPPTSTLFGVSSTKGLLAAAGPKELVVASTEAVRAAFADPNIQADGNKVKPFSPALSISTPRISQVAFTSEGKWLAISAEQGGGLAVYETQSLTQGNKECSFQIGTENISVRALAPNPNPEFEKYAAVVLSDSKLLLADFVEKNLVDVKNGGPVLHENVSCISWSTKGKQIVAGLGDGTAVQLDMTGTVKAVIPRPPQLSGNEFMSRILWISNDEFMTIHASPSTDESAVQTHFVSRDKGSSVFKFEKVQFDPIFPSMNSLRLPQHHYICRLRAYPPALKELIITCSSASADFGIYASATASIGDTNSDAPDPAKFMAVMFMDDSRRIMVPPSTQQMDADTMDEPETSPIGIALDLSATEKAVRPIPADEMDESPMPLPALMTLNNEGVLSCAWVVYNDAIRQGVVYSEMTTASKSGPTTTQGQSPMALPATTSAFGSAPPALSAPKATFGGPGMSSGGFGGTSALGQKTSVWGGGGGGGSAAPQTGGSAFGQSTFGSKPAFGQPASDSKPAFGQPASDAKPAFGQSAFGSKPAFGQPASGSQPAFGKPAFGSTSAIGGASGGSKAFGASSGLGQNQSPWAAVNNNSSQLSSTSKPANPFGGASTSTASPFSSLPKGDNAASPFSTLPKGDNAASPFSALNNGQGPSGFSALGQTGKPSAFASPQASTSTPTPSFGGSTLGGPSVFGTPRESTSMFGQPQKSPVPVTHESDMSDASDPTPSKPAQGIQPPSLFGGSSGFQLGSTFKADHSKDDAADDKADEQKPKAGGLFGDGFNQALPDTKKEDVPATPIKQEPDTEERPSLKDIPTTPASPPKNIKSDTADAAAATMPDSDSEDDGDDEEQSGADSSSPLAGSSPEEVSPVDDAPLPPDPSSIKKPDWFNKPIPGASNTPQTKVEPKPLPADSSSMKLPSLFSQSPSAGSSSMKLPPLFGQATQPTSATPESKPPTTLFGELKPGAPLAAPTPLKGTPETRPPLFQTQSNTPAGFPQPSGPSLFAPPTAVAQQSPRSPSPVRSASTPAGPAGRPLMAATHKPPSRPSSRLVKQQSSQPSIPQQPEYTASDLDDEDDLRIREELAAPLEPTTTLGQFVAHSDYVGEITKSGLPGQIERLYRDVNSMIDTLGLNARTVACWVDGHSDNKERTKDDLADPDDWHLVELEDLAQVQNEIGKELDAGKLTNVEGLLIDLRKLNKESSQLKLRVSEVRKYINAAQDPTRKAVKKREPLPESVAKVQQSVRDKHAEVSTQLAEAEEKIMLLKGKLAGKGGRPVPTVEAVERTVQKMTNMIMEKSADVDVLEAQLRKLKLANSRSSPARNARDSRFGTPMRSSALGRSHMEAAGSSPFGPAHAGMDELADVMGGLKVDAEKARKERIAKKADLMKRRQQALKTLGKALEKREVKVRHAYEKSE
ncbi:hypothetical protein K402DRAFT_465442 [Aulographum hederae CBS 113979]|uniref:Nucleoporin Nup159/Nup146 N-terminal domain-containing protein n=1 Tax=Aulographum hederae CBS 113979 TaxID=1176131 RepID=A0A6G1GSX4_9PEZI|nr:hypothetical protein K402DRAFT_465442 [Aulographum hederae CBS 113979]